MLSTQIKTLYCGLRQSLAVARAPQRLPLVASVVGLDNTRKSHPRLFHSEALTSSPGGISQDTIKSAYGFDPIYKSGWSGKGQHIAVATYMGFKIEDVQHFY